MSTDTCAQHFLECSKCNYRKVECYCKTCTKSLCVQCRKKHESKRHNVVIYRQKMMEEELCAIHSVFPYIMCCQQCKTPVCQKCIKENHKKHSFLEIEDFFDSQKEQYFEHISRIRNELLPKSTSLLVDIQSHSLKCNEEISKIQSAMTSKAQVLKDIIDAILEENTASLQGITNSIISELKGQENVINNHITYLQNIADECHKYIASKQYARFLLFQQKNSVTNLKEIPQLAEIQLPSMTDGEILKEDIARMFGKVQEFTKTEVKKVKNEQKNNSIVERVPAVTEMARFTVPDVQYSHHISPVTSEQAWVSDWRGNLVLTDIKGKKMNGMMYANDIFGCHAVCDKKGFIYLNKEHNGINEVAATKKKPKVLVKDPQKAIKSIYSSPSNGDILVGMGFPSEAKIIRYKKTGKEIYQIQHDTTGKPLYDWPRFITENHLNKDICVSDNGKRAVIVVDENRTHRFSYTGHPQGSVLRPWGISTDTQGHILVSDYMSQTVQLTDKDGLFLLFLLTTKQGINTPAGLSLDIRNSLLWVGEFWDKTVSIYRYKPRKEHVQLGTNL